MEYNILRWTGSPLENLLNMPNMFIESLQDLLIYVSSHHHDIHLSTSTLISQTLQQATFRCTPCGSCTTTQLQWHTSAAICAHKSLPQYSHVSHMDRQCQVPLHQP